MALTWAKYVEQINTEISGLRPKSRKIYRLALVRFFTTINGTSEPSRWKPASTITRAETEAYFSELQTPSQKLIVLSALRHFWKHADIRRPFPGARIKIKTVKRTKREQLIEQGHMPSNDDCKKLIDACDNADDRMLMRLLIDTGDRMGVFCRLERSMVDWERGCLHVPAAIRKGEAIESHPLLRRETIDALRQYLADRQDNLPWLVLHDRKQLVEYRPYNLLVRTIRNKVTDKKFTTHFFRHLRCRELLIEGYTPHEVRVILGWKDMQMIDRIYGKLQADDVLTRSRARVEGKAPKPGLENNELAEDVKLLKATMANQQAEILSLKTQLAKLVQILHDTYGQHGQQSREKS